MKITTYAIIIILNNKFIIIKEIRRNSIIILDYYLASFRQTVSECHILGYLLLYFASCVNPIIYVIMNKQYRQAYAGVIGCKWIRATLTPYGSSVPGGAGGLQAHQHDYAQGNFEQRHAVTLTKL